SVGDRGGYHVRVAAGGEGPVGAVVGGGMARRGGSASGGVQRGAWRQGGGGPDLGAPPDRGGVVRGVAAHCPLHLRERHPPRKACPGVGRSQEPHGGAARRRHGTGRRRRGVGRVRVGG